jgi:peptidoglycan/LPS O-acetylase OafA/YrhL
MQPLAPRRPYLALTSLRFIAAALVVVTHAARWNVGLRPESISPYYMRAGMSFFFILSGFILAHVYPDFSSLAETGRFFRARWARLWPAHLVGLLACVLIPSLHTFEEHPWAGRLLNGAMLHAWVPLHEYYASYNGPSWSISTELGLYCLFPLLIFRWRRTWPLKILATLAIIASLIFFCTRAAGQYPDLVPGLLYYNPLSRVFEFAMGIAAYQGCRYLAPRMHLGRPLGTVVELAALALVILNMRYSLDIIESLPFLRDLGLTVFWLKSGAICCFSFAVVIMVAALEQGWISRLLTVAPLVVLGEMSYSIYLFHLPLIRFLDKGLGRPWEAAWPEAPDWAVFLYFWILLLLLTHLTWNLIERPFRGLITGRGFGLGKYASFASETTRNGWAQLFTPGWGSLAAEVLLLIGVALPAFQFAEPPPVGHKTIPELLRDLKDPDEEVRRQAAEALGDRKGEPAVITPGLVALLHDEAGRVRSEAAKSLWKIGPWDRTAVRELGQALNDDYLEVRRHAAGALGKAVVAQGIAVEALEMGLEDPVVEVRGTATRSLGKLAESAPEAIPVLAEALKDPDANVRVEAARSLGPLGGKAKKVLPLLQEVLRDPSPDVREAVAEAVNQIKGS